MRFTMILDGHSTVVNNLRRLTTTVTRQANLSGWNAAQHLYARTRAVVPYLDGELYESAFIEKVGEHPVHMWAVGYDTNAVPYAITVHETPNRVHPTRGPSNEPKQDHFLSEPRDAMVKTYSRTMAEDLERAIMTTKFERSVRRRR